MRCWLLLSCLLVTVALPAARAADDPATTLLLQQADSWQARGRPDLVRKALDKLLIVAPDNAEALTRLALLEIREGHPEAARSLLARLASRHPDHPGIGRIEQMLRLAGPERSRLQRARLLAKSGQTEAAIAAYDELFPQGPPSDELAFEYWQLVAQQAGERQRALRGLADLVERHPNNPVYRLAWLDQALVDQPRNTRLLEQLIPYTRDSRYQRQAASIWRRALRRLDADPEDIPLYRRYLAYDPEDELIQARLASAEARQSAGHRQARSELASSPAPRARQAESPTASPVAATPVAVDPDKRKGLQALEQGRLAAAKRLLGRAHRRHPDDGEITGALGLVRLRQGDHGKAAALFRQATQQDADNRSKWQSLENTARFWQLLRLADAAEAKRDYPQAARLIAQALRIDPGNAHGLAALAHVRVLQQQEAAAEDLFRRALRRQADNGTALRGLLGLLIDQGRLDEAGRFIDGLSRAQRRALGDDLDRLQADRYRAEAEQLLAAGQLAAAGTRLEQALQLTPDNPWLRYDLAKLDVRQGRPDQGIARFEQALGGGSDDPDLYYAYALLLGSLGRESEGAALLRRVPEARRSAGMQRTLSRLHTTVELQQVRALRQQGELAAASERLQALEQVMAEDPAQLLRVADAWVDLGEDDRALTLLDRLMALPLASDQQALRSDIALQRARLLRGQGRLEEALALLENLTVPEARRDAVDDELARLYQAMGNHLAAAAIYQRRLARNPEAIAPRFALARVWTDAGEVIRAADTLRALEPRLPRDDIEGRLALADAWRAIGDADHARRLLDALLADHPGEPRLLLRLADAEADPDRRLALLEQAREALATSGGRVAGGLPEPASLDRRIALLKAERSLVFNTSFDLDDRTSTDGKSSLTSLSLPMELRGPAARGGNWFVRVEPVSLDAGALALGDADEMNTFGQGLFCFPACPAADSDQSARGVAFGIGYQREDLRLDIGTTPIGFLVEDIIGGVVVEGDLGDFSWGMDVSRRPMSGTLLTVAGTRDPNSGEVWGGVRASGVTFSLSYDLGGPFGFWSNLGLHYLDGENVADNRRARLMAGSYWKFINDDDRRLSVGLNAGIWRHAKALDEFTFGHGGYYSPNRYFSLSLPVNYYARHGSRLSYRLGGSISQSWSHEDRTAYFPNDPDLQAAAEAQQPITGVDPYYAGGPGGGFGYALEAALEYKVDEHLTLGAAANTEQSDFYAPNRATFYLRYSFERDPRPVRMPPAPLEPYLSF